MSRLTATEQKNFKQMQAVLRDAETQTQTVKAQLFLKEKQIKDRDVQVYELVLQVQKLTAQVQRFTISECLRGIAPDCITKLIIEYSAF